MKKVEIIIIQWVVFEGGLFEEVGIILHLNFFSDLAFSFQPYFKLYPYYSIDIFDEPTNLDADFCYESFDAEGIAGAGGLETMFYFALFACTYLTSGLFSCIYLL